MQYVVGAYSQLPYGTSDEEYEALLARQLKPLLTMVYRNSNYKLLFRLSISEFEYLEVNHPEVNMLINDLCRKGQMEILTSSFYDAVLSLVPTHERTTHIERATTYIRKKFSKKPKGLWFYNQVFNPTTVPLVGLSGLNYIVISTYNQVNNSVESTRPFYTDEMGKESLVFPIDDRFSKETCDLYRGNITLDRYLSEVAKMAKETTNAISTIMLNMDQLMGTEGSADVYRVLYENLGPNSTLPSLYIQDNEVSRTHYLPNGIYGRDFQIGKATSINQLIYDNPMLAMNYGVLNMLKDVLRDSKKLIDDRKSIETVLMKASSCSLYFPDESKNPAILRNVNHFACEAEALLSKMPNNILPDEVDADFDRSKEFYVKGKSSIAYLGRKGAVISRYVVVSSLYDIAFHSGEGLFADSFVNDVTGKEMRLSAKPYEVTPLDKRNSDFFAKAPAINLGKLPVNLTKRFKFRQTTLVLEIEVENLSSDAIKGFTYVSTIDLALPRKSTVTCPERNIEDGESATTQSIMVSDRACPFSVSIVLGEEAEIQRADFSQKTRTWLGDKGFYEYTQLKIKKKLSLGPMESMRLTIGFRTEKRKEKHNDTAEQSAP